MRCMKVFGWLALVVGVAAIPVAAQDGYWQRRDIYNDQRDLRRDYSRVEHLRADIARDRARLNEHIRCGNDRAAAADAADLARDQRVLDALLRDIQRDRRDVHRDYRRYENGYSGYGGGYYNRGYYTNGYNGGYRYDRYR